MTTHQDARPQVPRKVLRDLFERMLRVRLFEEEAGRLTEQGRVPGFLHLYVGEEAVAAGVTAAMHQDDQLASTHRGHGHVVARGADLGRMYAELLGREGGFCRGKGGSMHVSDLELGILGANGIVGGGLPIAVGAAFANKYAGTDRVAVAFFGDGASNSGAFHEATNMAAALTLPIVFVCENNLYGEFTRQTDHQAVADIADRAAGYGIPGAVVDGMDVCAVYDIANQAITRAREGSGPSLIEAKTYRFYDHQGVKGLRIPYRSDEEVDAWKTRDPLVEFEREILGKKVISQKALGELKESMRIEIEVAIAFAESSPEPDPSQLATDVYTEVTS